MKPIAVFYHTRLDGGEPEINSDHAMGLLYEQMLILETSGLEDAASEIIVGITCSHAHVLVARSVIAPKAKLVIHAEGAKSELPTLALLRSWLGSHDDWYVFYHQAKGVTRPGSLMHGAWRNCMQFHLVRHWRQCVADLDQGFHSVGCHWLTPQRYPGMAPMWAKFSQFPGIVNTPYWGGNFWWAKSGFLRTLPELPENAYCKQDFFLAESWIGMGKLPLVKDYAPHWPSLKFCGAAPK